MNDATMLKETEFSLPLALLSTAEMARADRLTIEAGRPGIELMEAAGRHVAGALELAPAKGRLAVLCGPGNNGGDGFVAARLARRAGWEVRLGLLGDASALSGDAAAMERAWDGDIEEASPALLEGADCIVDALFGAGLSRPLEGRAAELVEAVNASNALVVAVDIPSGLDGDTGLVRGAAVEADVTVTFFRARPGHLLMPGRLMCGEVLVRDIGIEAQVLDILRPHCFRNLPPLWAERFPVPRLDGHKYFRGHVLALTGHATSTGAGRLAASGALRAGAGLVTVGSPADALTVNAAHLTAIMLTRCDGAEDLGRLLSENKRFTLCMGPGLGVNGTTWDMVRAALASGVPAVFDADVLTIGAQHKEEFCEGLHDRIVLTPHVAEFRRVWPEALAEGRLAAARRAARETGAVVVLKGAGTLVSTDMGNSLCSAGNPGMSSAGMGDVLTGVIAGLLAQGLELETAAQLGVCLHGAAADQGASAAGERGLLAGDLFGPLRRLVNG
ncbi:MAG: NAD(P)H-hydrate dehydratase [Alphaproteobacteria bacterium]